MHISLNARHDRVAGGSGILSGAGSAFHPQTNDKQTGQQRDKLSISIHAQNLFNQQGGKKTMLERLMEQKQNIVERRADYISNALEKGTSPEDIKYGLERIEQQIEELDKQIQLIQHKEMTKATGSIPNTDGENGERPKVIGRTIDKEDSNATAVADSVQALVSVHNELKQTHSIKQAQLTLETEAKNWESDPVRSAKLKSRAEELNGKMIREIRGANDELASSIREDEGVAPDGEVTEQALKEAQDEES